MWKWKIYQGGWVQGFTLEDFSMDSDPAYELKGNNEL